MAVWDVTLRSPGTNAWDVSLSAGQAAATGSLSVTLGNVTLSGEGDVSIAGALAVTLGNITLSGAAAVTSTVLADLDAALEDVTLAGAGVVTTAEAGSGYFAPEIFYPRPIKKVEENDEAIVMAMLMMLDEVY